MFGSFDKAIDVLRLHGTRNPDQKHVVDELIAILQAENQRELEEFNRGYQARCSLSDLTDEEIASLNQKLN